MTFIEKKNYKQIGQDLSKFYYWCVNWWGVSTDVGTLYRKEFIERWKQYERRFHLFDNDGNPLPPPTGFVLPPSINANHRFRLILVTHDESTFFQNDERKNVWAPKDELAPPKPKGDGQSLMVSDFLTVEWGRLKDENEYVIHGH